VVALARSASTPVSLSILLVVAAFLGSLGDAVLDRVVLTGIISLIVVVGLYTFVGLSGVFSFGHIGFMAIGAYGSGLLVMDPQFKGRLLPDLPNWLGTAHWESLPATLFGGLLAAVFALIIAAPIVRISGLTASLAMFAVLLIVNVVIRNWEGLTAGTKALGPIPTTTTRDRALVYAVIAIFVAFVFQQSRFGLKLRTSREDEVAARAIGVSVARERGVAFVLSAFIVGVAGALQGQLLNSFSPDAFFLSATFFTIAMLVVGGFTSLSGAVVGSIAVTAVGEGLRRIEAGVDIGPTTVDAPSGLRELGIALLILVVLAIRPTGIMGGRELRLPHRLGGGPLPRKSAGTTGDATSALAHSGAGSAAASDGRTQESEVR
jgi:branched-chain amino acid transport system permease protein